MTTPVEHIDAVTWHGRKGSVQNAFRYTIDYILLDAEGRVDAPALFGRNRSAVMSLFDNNHGGPPGDGRGAIWARQVLGAHGIENDVRLRLLAQPRVLGHVFNPVSFWLAEEPAGGLRAVIAEVTNTFGDRHSYLCAKEDSSPITSEDTIRAAKVFHVSPFQEIAGEYTFRFDIDDRRIAIRIDHANGDDGLVATLVGPRRPLTNRAILRAMLRRPLGSRRVLGLIHWQALKLWWKGAVYRARPLPPTDEVSR